MLNKDDIRKISKTNGLSLKNTEKDYLLELVLSVISKAVGKELIFKGGTAIYKFHSLDRFSEDLDFTLLDPKLDVKKLCLKVLGQLKKTGIGGRLKNYQPYTNSKKATLELNGPLFDGNKKNCTVISIDISLKEKPIYPGTLKKLYPGYTNITTFDVWVMDDREMFAEKVRALLERDKARDLYDVDFLFNKGILLNRSDINKKLKKHGNKLTDELLQAKINEKSKSWDMDLKPLIIGNLPDFNIVKQKVLKKFKELK